MYPSIRECRGSPAKFRQVPLKHEGKDCSVPQQQEINQIFPDKEEAEKQKQRLGTWNYHCQVPDAEVNKQSKLTETAVLSAEEMQFLDEDIQSSGYMFDDIKEQQKASTKLSRLIQELIHRLC